MDDYDPFNYSVIARPASEPAATTTTTTTTKTPKQLRASDGQARATTTPQDALHQQSQVTIITTSISRSAKPANLTLAKSNGSTASFHAPVACEPSESTATSVTQEDSSPKTKAASEVLPHPSAVAMGNSGSKSETNFSEGIKLGADAQQGVKRKPVGGEYGRKMFISPTQTLEGLKHMVQDTKPEHLRINSHEEPSPLHPPRVDSLQSPPLNHALPPTPPDEESASEDDGPSSSTGGRTGAMTPRLPSPPRLNEETPSKYGMVLFDQLDHGHLRQKQSRHFRGKSSTALTALHMFKAGTQLQQAHDFLNTVSPPSSRPTTPLIPGPSSPIRISSSSTTPTEPHVAELLTAGDDSSRRTSVSAVQSTPSSLSNSSNVGGRILATHTPPNSPVGTVSALIPAKRPGNTTAPFLTVMQSHCLHQHRRWRLSKNSEAPVACALCFVDKDHLSGEDGPGERWSCVWCALRVCLACRNKVETSMSRNPAKALTGSAVRRPPWVPNPYGNRITPFPPPPPPPQFYGDMASRSISDLRDLSRPTSGASFGHDRRMSVSAATESTIRATDMRNTPTIQRTCTQMSQVEYADDDATPKQARARAYRRESSMETSSYAGTVRRRMRDEDSRPPSVMD